MATPLLFTPLKLREVEFANRAWLAPMCQQSVTAEDGKPNDWHIVHYGARANGGFGLILAEASAIAAEGRISPRDLGIWDDSQLGAWEHLVNVVHAAGTKFGTQIAHAGRKASVGSAALSPSTVPFPDYDTPVEMTQQDITRVIKEFVAAAVRADKLGMDMVEIHAAHGYLLHSFCSPLSNHRTDAYGGSLENRIRFVLQVTEAVREVWPTEKPLFLRTSASEWVEGGFSVEEAAAMAKELKPLGVDLIDVSSGGNIVTPIPTDPGYQVPLAEVVRTAGIPVSAVGLITEPAHAEQILRDGKADAIFLGRVAMREPSWPFRAAHELGVPAAEVNYPVQYAKGAWDA